jgi:hypothetical protein
MVDKSSLILILGAAIAVIILWRLFLWLIAVALIALLILGTVQISSMIQTSEAVSTVDTMPDARMNPYHCPIHTGLGRSSEFIRGGIGECWCGGGGTDGA